MGNPKNFEELAEDFTRRSRDEKQTQRDSRIREETWDEAASWVQIVIDRMKEKVRRRRVGDLYPRQTTDAEVTVSLGFKRGPNETTFDAMKRVAESHSLWEEVRADYEMGIKDGLDPDNAAWGALYEWDCCEVMCEEPPARSCE